MRAALLALYLLLFTLAAPTATSALSVIVTGDFRPFAGLEEDSAVVAVLLTLHEIAGIPGGPERPLVP